MVTPLQRRASFEFLSDPGLLVRSMCLVLSNWLTDWVSERRLWNFTDLTPADEDTNWILTDNDKKAFQGNVAMWLNLVANFGTLEVMSCIKRPNFEPICNKSENTYFNEIGRTTLQRKVALKSAPAISDENQISILICQKLWWSRWFLWCHSGLKWWWTSKTPTEKWKWGA